MKKILVIGSLNMDLVIGLNQMPLEGETILGNNLSYIPGGKRCKSSMCCGTPWGRCGNAWMHRR